MKKQATLFAIIVIFLVNTQDLLSQSTMTMNFGIEAFAPVGSWSNNLYIAGAGLDFSMNYFLNNKTSLGVNSGFKYLLVDNKVRDISDDYFAYFIPVHLQSNYFLSGNYKEGGIFSQVQGGVNVFKIESKTSGIEQNTSETNPTFSVGIGFQDKRRFQYILRYHSILNDSNNLNYLAFNLGFNFY